MGQYRSLRPGSGGGRVAARQFPPRDEGMGIQMAISPFSLRPLRLFKLSFAVLLFVAGCGQSKDYHGIEIIGSGDFKSQVRSALNLLRTEAPEEFTVVAIYVKRIEEHERSGMDAARDPPTCQLAPATAYASITWCAGVISHEAHHAFIFQSISESYGGRHEEKECIGRQIEVMKRIGAPQWELDYLAGLDGSHFDLDGDGEYTWKDYELRDW